VFELGIFKISGSFWEIAWKLFGFFSRIFWNFFGILRGNLLRIISEFFFLRYVYGGIFWENFFVINFLAEIFFGGIVFQKLRCRLKGQ
jgi:hypothetical protein